MAHHDPNDKTLAPFPDPPHAWLPMRRMVGRVAAPFESFLATESASGILLLIATAVALIWANSPAHHSYEHLWHTPISLGIGDWSFTASLHFWISDFLMTIFFLVAGLEIKRELFGGELRDVRRASLPIAGAIGGMLVPAAIYIAFNQGTAGSSGWGIPMATDIAFAVGILTLLGNRVPSGLRILLLAIAIIDDIGAILIIAIFYSTEISIVGFEIVFVGLATLLLFRQIGVRPGHLYWIPLLTLWIGFFIAGIHPTISGVIVGLSFPVVPWLRREQFTAIAERSLLEYHQVSAADHLTEHDLLRPLRRLVVAGREALSPVVRAEAAFHPIVAYGIMPLFALANAGVNLSSGVGDSPAAHGVMYGTAFGLIIGKPIGVFLIAFLAVKIGICSLPTGVNWKGMAVVGMVAGIGFTMSMFIGGLAFPGAPELLGPAKLGILAGTFVTSIAGLAMGYMFLPKPE